MEAMKKLDESGPARPVIFVAVNLTNLPSIMLPTVLSTSNNQTINDDDNVRHRLIILEMQMDEILSTKMTSASYPASREPSLQGAWSRARQFSQHAPHFMQQQPYREVLPKYQRHRSMYSHKVLHVHLQRPCVGQNGTYTRKGQGC